MRSTTGGVLARLVAGGAAGAVALSGLAVGLTAPAHAAVTVSGSVVDAAGNYASGIVSAFGADGALAGSDFVDNGAFDIALPDGTYKLRFSSASSVPEYATEWYRDKADEATADVIVVAGAATTLPAWTVDRAANVTGVVRTTDGRGVASAFVQAFDAATGNPVGTTSADRSGGFRLAANVPVKLQFSGSDSLSNKRLATEWFNDKTSLATADPVTPVAGAGADLGVVTLAPGGSITGRITTETGAPIYRAQACSGSVCDDTDVNGSYLLEGVSTGENRVRFEDPIREFVGEYYNNVPLTNASGATVVNVAPGQAVTAIDAALAVAPVVAPTGVDVSGTVRDELGGIGIGYQVQLHSATVDPRDSELLATTYSDRAGRYYFSELDRIGGVSQFKILVQAGQSREKGEFARRSMWSGDKVGEATASIVTATSPGTLDFTLPVAGGVSGAVTSEAGGRPESPSVSFRNLDEVSGSSASEINVDGTYDQRTLWAGDYTVAFGGYQHVTEWWENALPEDAVTITVKPGEMVTGISAALSKEVKAVTRPAIAGDAWVGKTLRVDQGRWNTQASSRFTYEWLVDGKVIATGPELKVVKSHLGDKITARVTNDAGFAQGQAVTSSTPKVGLAPKLKAKVTARSATLKLKVKSLKAKKVKASVVVYEVRGTRADGEPKLKKLGKGKIKGGTGKVRFAKALGRGKHTLVFRLTGKGKVGSGDLTKKVKIKR